MIKIIVFAVQNRCYYLPIFSFYRSQTNVEKNKEFCNNVLNLHHIGTPVIGESWKIMGSDQFCLKWNDYHSSLTAEVSKIRDEDDFFDISLVCGDNIAKAHRLVLSACSPLFRWLQFFIIPTSFNPTLCLIVEVSALGPLPCPSHDGARPRKLKYSPNPALIKKNYY